MSKRSMRSIAAVAAVCVAVVAAFVLTLRLTGVGKDSPGVQAGPQPTIASVSYEELIPYLTATVMTADLLRRCTDPTPTPSDLSQKGLRTIASQKGLALDNITWQDEYTVSNKQDDSGKRKITAFGDEVRIVVLRLLSRPEGYNGSGMIILAIDPQTGKLEDLNKDGRASEYIRPPTGFNTWHCTPEPTPDWTPVPSTPENMARPSLVATAGTQ